MEGFTKVLGTTATLPLLGVGFIFAWAYAPLMAGQEFYLFHHLGFGICLLFVALAAARKGRFWALARRAPQKPVCCRKLCYGPGTRCPCHH